MTTPMWFAIVAWVNAFWWLGADGINKAGDGGIAVTSYIIAIILSLLTGLTLIMG